MNGEVVTVRVIVRAEEKILMLRKSKDSRNPNKLEFPGGKVDFVKGNEYDENLIQSAVRELEEESGIKVQINDLRKIDFQKKYEFEIIDRKFKRLVHYYYLTLEAIPEIKINTLKEDAHAGFEWISLEGYLNNLDIAENSRIELDSFKNIY